MKHHEPIAIIGLGCLFPGCAGLKDYWRLLFHAQDAITDVPATHWSAADYFDADPKAADHVYCTRGGFLPPIDFNPMEFGIPPSNLEATDSSQLLALVSAKMALEDAGYGETRGFDKERVSVILGVTGTQELAIPLSARLGHPRWRRALIDSGVLPQKTEEVIRRISDSYVPWQENSFPGLLGNVVAGRICNRLGFGGTNCVVDAACASSLSAINLAVLELASGRSDMVISGGVDTLNDIFMHMCFSKTYILSPTGDVRPFSKDADGTLLGEGLGMIVLKRLEDAEREGDKIYAVIRGIGSSSDGRSHSIYAPRPEGQEKALCMAYEQAGIDPVTVELIEAHGTGTRVGDEVEFEALTRVFSRSARNGCKCALGSVKSMIGHTKAAAGAAGLIKAALALHHKILPPTLKVGEPDPKLHIAESPFYLNTRTRPWLSRPDHLRRSGVSSFGFGGSNFHVVLEEYRTNKEDISWDGSVDILSFSASSQNELMQSVQEFKQTADTELSTPELANRCAQLRKSFSHQAPFRLLLVHERSQDIRSRLHSALEACEQQQANSSSNRSGVFYGRGSAPGKLAWVFPGQGSQYVGMGRYLVSLFPQAFETIEKANRYVAGTTQLSDYIYPPEPHSSQEKKDQEDALQQTDIAQPAIGAVCLGLAKILQYFEVHPAAVCGHSFGELTALCAAGWIADGDFLKLAVRRGTLMAAAGRDSHQPSGAMLAVQGPLEELTRLLQGSNLDVVLANRNSPNQGVLSGRAADIDKAQALFRKRGLKAVRLPVSAAFHSPMVEEARQPFAEALHSIGFSPSNVAVMSNTTGSPYPSDPDAARRLLSDHLIRPVDFIGDVEHLYETGVRCFIEIGPKSVLSGLIRSILADRFALTAALDGSHGTRFGLSDLALILCQLAANGFPVRLSKWEDPVSERGKPPMTITLHGANYVAPKRQDEAPQSPPDRLAGSGTDAATTKPEADPPRDSKQNIDSRGTDDQNSNNSTEPLPAALKTGNAMAIETKPENADRILQALSIVQEGLRSMQTLQAQTAQAHQKFLESQTEASRTLQEMMKHTRRLAGVAFNHQPTPIEWSSNYRFLQPATAGFETSLKPSEPMAPAPPEVVHPGVISTPAAQPNRMLSPGGAAESPTAAESGIPRISELEDTLLEVVSQLTGYPVDMLGLDMDIEADLGIDSIKRVEILSTLEEKMPGLPTVSPEIMGRLKTLGQIMAYLADTPERKSAEPSDALANAPELPPSETFCTSLQTPGIESSLLEVVSQLTGYPVDMLGLDMDIEADLGIDSIKRVEILSTLEEKMPGLPAVSPEIMGRLKTLGQIVGFLTSPHEHQDSDPVSPAVLGGQLASVHEQDLSTTQPAEPAIAAIQREIVVVKDAGPRPRNRISLPTHAKIFVTDDQTGLARSITDVLLDLGINGILISADILKYKKELPKVCGLVFVQNPRSDDPAADLTHAFELAKYLSSDLTDSGRGGGAVLATVSRLDGMFGLSGNAIQNPVQGGLAGLTKTAALEWPEVLCHALDISPTWRDTREIAHAVVQEILTPGPVEIGLSPESRITVACETQATPEGLPNLSTGDVVVISGGARGITAEAAKALSRSLNPAVVLIGRSAPPSSEPEWLACLKSEADIKQAILEHEFGGRNTVPAQLEQTFKARMVNREILATVESLKSNGSVVRYYGIDVRDFAGLRTILDDVRRDLGPVRAIIHGAGVIEDRLIADKSIAQFDRVVSTKVAGLQALLHACRQDPLKYLVIFSSVAGRWGNRGQADYACANEALNKIAQQEAISRPDCRVVSINWGPWEGGMVSPSLRREFERRGVSLIPLEIGAQCLLKEMAATLRQPAEVIIGGKLQPAAGQSAAHCPPKLHAVATSSKPALTLTFEREIDVARYPILQSHVIGGKPVVPFALIAEWLGHGALHANPGLILHGLDDVRILKGIRLEHPAQTIRILSGKAKNRGLVYEVPVELRNGQTDPKDLVHCRTTAVLAQDFTTPPTAEWPSDADRAKYHRSPHEIYDKILFHGSGLQGIREVVSCSSSGMVARIASAPPPTHWMHQPLRSRWLTDPLILDSAFQIASLWCYEERGFVSLPSYAASYRQYQEQLPADGVHVVLDVIEATDRKMRGDFTFLDASGVVVARMTGVEAVMDETLYQAFKPQYAAQS